MLHATTGDFLFEEIILEPLGPDRAVRTSARSNGEEGT
jgi:hypothetical protein